MKNYKLVISYDGTRYKGWQRLKNDTKSIQYKIEEILSKLYGHDIKIIGSGRTDAGVHAKHQVANYQAKDLHKTEEILAYVNHYLPEDIAVSSIEEVGERFHARFNVVEKHYQYNIWNGVYADVFARKYSYWVKESLNIEMMIKAAKLFEGEHDFEGFSKRSKNKNTVKNIRQIKITVDGNRIIIDCFGEGFLYNMVRVITGTILEIGLGTRGIESINEIFTTKNRDLAGVTVPAQGLCLMNVIYKD